MRARAADVDAPWALPEITLRGAGGGPADGVARRAGVDPDAAKVGHGLGAGGVGADEVAQDVDPGRALVIQTPLPALPEITFAAAVVPPTVLLVDPEKNTPLAPLGMAKVPVPVGADEVAQDQVVAVAGEGDAVVRVARDDVGGPRQSSRRRCCSWRGW